MKITTIGIDLAKEMFQIHGVDTQGKFLLRKQLRRSEIAKHFSQLAPCLIGMEACGSQVGWAGSAHALTKSVVKAILPRVF